MMKIKMLREHYVSKDSGVTWKPKESFDTLQEMEIAGYPPWAWDYYTCSYCAKIHKGSFKDR